MASAAAAGLLTGVKAVVNGSATAIKSVATLGSDSSQLELIGVTKEDRDKGYDTAVQISTASRSTQRLSTGGQVLLAVGTGEIASALSMGGKVARTASGALIAKAGGEPAGE